MSTAAHASRLGARQQACALFGGDAFGSGRLVHDDVESRAACGLEGKLGDASKHGEQVEARVIALDVRRQQLEAEPSAPSWADPVRLPSGRASV